MRSTLPMRARLFLSALLSSCVLVTLTGCGRPATQKECEEIVERITLIELKARGMAENTQEIAATKEALRKTTLRDCVGRRISDEAMACVRKAGTTQQILNECF
ncbi:MAG TPA: hypothetical protein VFQ61_28910 [Polyangiaceae bacterium]|nr:hypothetical protein [Polyangiaceae bacterium]